jgi:hypothetical protein
MGTDTAAAWTSGLITMNRSASTVGGDLATVLGRFGMVAIV